MISKKELSFGIIMCLIGGSISIFLLEVYTIPNETIRKDGNLSYYINLNYLNNHPRFNYFHGLWLMFTGIFWFGLMIIMEVKNIESDLRMMLILKIIKKKKD